MQLTQLDATGLFLGPEAPGPLRGPISGRGPKLRREGGSRGRNRGQLGCSRPLIGPLRSYRKPRALTPNHTPSLKCLVSPLEAKSANRHEQIRLPSKQTSPPKWSQGPRRELVHRENAPRDGRVDEWLVRLGRAHARGSSGPPR